MQLIHYSFDALRLGGLAMRATDELGTFDVTIPSGELSHVDFTAIVDHRGNSPARVAAIQELATVLTAALQASKTGTGDWFVQWRPLAYPTPFYDVSYDGDPSYSIDFRAASVGPGGPRLARAMGFLDSAVIATTIGVALTSTLRPAYLLIPAAMGRTKVSPDRYEGSIATDARTDGGVYGQTSVARAAVTKDWSQAGEDETSIGAVAYGEPGTPVHAYRATTAVPWSYQHAWDHALTYKCAILVDDGNPLSPVEVVEMRAEGLVFSPMFTGADDFPMYSVEFKTRLLGRVP